MSHKKRVNKYPRAFQLMALERMKHCERVSARAKELGIHRTVLYHWKNQIKATERCPDFAAPLVATGA